MLPKINLSQLQQQLSEEDFIIAQGIIASKGKNKGCLRASKPPVAKKIKKTDDTSFFGTSYQFKNKTDELTGKTAYVWRMVAFFISPISQHQCMPMTCDFDLDGSAKTAQETAKELDKLVDVIVDTVPKEQWHGVQRWKGLV